MAAIATQSVSSDRARAAASWLTEFAVLLNDDLTARAIARGSALSRLADMLDDGDVLPLIVDMAEAMGRYADRLESEEEQP